MRDKHSILRNSRSGSKIANAVFVPVTGKFVVKKTRALENVADV